MLSASKLRHGFRYQATQSPPRQFPELSQLNSVVARGRQTVKLVWPGFDLNVIVP